MEALDAANKRVEVLEATIHDIVSGMDVNTNLFSSDDEVPDLYLIDNTTLLHVLSARGVEKEVASLLRDPATDANAREGRGRTPLMLACRGGHQGCVDMLLNSRAAEGLELTSDEDEVVLMSALHHAIACGHLGIVQTLLRHGANTTGGDDFGYTALHFACGENQPASVAALIEHNADLEAATSDGNTALHISCDVGSIACLSVLLTAGANASAKNNFSQTGLHWPPCGCISPTNTERGRVACAQLLLTAGTDVNARDDDGSTPVENACRTGNFALTRTLLEGGADPFEADPQRKSLWWKMGPGRCCYTQWDVVRSARYARCHSLLQRATFLREASRVRGGLDWTPATHHLMAECDKAIVEAARRALLLVGKRRRALFLPRDVLFKVLAVVATCERG